MACPMTLRFQEILLAIKLFLIEDLQRHLAKQVVRVREVKRNPIGNYSIHGQDVLVSSTSCVGLAY